MFAAAVLVAVAAGGGAVRAQPTYPGPGLVTGDIGAHDPAVVRTPDGRYLAVVTGDNLPIKVSSDRTAFTDVGPVFPDGAPWTLRYTGGGPTLWAPDISYHDGVYHLYYSASTFGSQRSAIFLATSATGGSGDWTDRGLVIGSGPADDFNAIDPNLFVDDDGSWWLSFGSFWSGIRMVRLDPTTGQRADGTVHAVAGRGGDAIEAPFVVKRGDHYYLYVSFDLCCRGADSTYRVMVGRSARVTGPYTDRAGTPMTSGGGTELLAGHDRIHGPGHPAVLADADGDVLFYHYYTDDGVALLGVNLIAYAADGWPYLR